MAITYEFDVRPHLQRAKTYRMLRQYRWRELHKHDGRALAWTIILPALLLFWGLVIYALV
jgi:hypothetical protein